ncbi:MAG TPA: hypothetical protein VG225_14745 [Terracidiphilus sp.]|jgi:hypothetical protein|nr:hypothetical protein [Terracidiphilus sp.]
MKNLASISLLLLSTSAIACGQPPNPLLGKWKLSMPAGSKYAAFCANPMEFTATTQTLTWSWSSKPVTEKVQYNAAQTAVYPTTVYVMGNSANHQTYNFSSKNRMVDDSAAGCTYERQ